MNAIAATRPLVRPRFLKWSVVVFVVLLPIAAHAAWDYLEARRLKTAIHAIASKGELTTLHGTEPYPLVGRAAEAARYYHAAAALSSQDTDDWKTRLGERVAGAASSGVWPPPLIAEIRARVASREPALQLLDRAASLPFEGFGVGNSYSYRTSQLLDLVALNGLRTFLAALDGDGDRAAESLGTQIRLQRVIEHSGLVSFPWSLHFVPQLSMMVERTRPSAGALGQVAHSLEEVDHDDILKSELIRERAFLIDRISVNGLAYYEGMPRYDRVDVLEVVRRPWLAHVFNHTLEVFAGAIQAAKNPWPARINAVARVVEKPAATTGRIRLGPWLDAEFVAERISLLRCARVVLAARRFQLDHHDTMPEHLADLVPAYLETPPVDPFSGRALRFTVQATSYEASSVGLRNRGPAGRRVPSATFAGVNTENLGVRVRTQKKFQ